MPPAEYDRGIAAAEKLLKRQIAQRRREKSGHRQHARQPRGRLHAARRDADAAREFQTAHADPDGRRAGRHRRRQRGLARAAQRPAAKLRRELHHAAQSHDRRRAATNSAAVRTLRWPTRSAANRCRRRSPTSSARAPDQGSGACRAGAPGAGLEQAGRRAARHPQQRAGAAVRPARRERRQGAQASLSRTCASSATSCAPRSPSASRAMPT